MNLLPDKKEKADVLIMDDFALKDFDDHAKSLIYPICGSFLPKARKLFSSGTLLPY